MPERSRDRATAATSAQDLPRHIAVEGPIGVGKTTLATRLAETLHYPLLLEPTTENPFLDRFYRERRRHALPTQLFFLLHRARQVAALDDDLVGSVVVADFLIEKDRLFAEINLDADELLLYEQLWRSLDIHPPTPDLVIYLHAPPPVLVERIRRRGVDFERHIDDDYLTGLCTAYTNFFHHYSAAPLLIVNAAEIDFAHDDRHFEALFDQLRDFDGVRKYFNPNPTLL